MKWLSQRGSLHLQLISVKAQILPNLHSFQRFHFQVRHFETMFVAYLFKWVGR